jgi:hypothetical protein
MLRCSEWWVKEQARRRRIPFAWIGGGYRFTGEHVAEIVRLFEVRPIESMSVSSADIARRPVRRPSDSPDGSPSLRLRARPPRRTRRAVTSESSVA